MMRAAKKIKPTGLVLAMRLGDWRQRLLLASLAVFSLTLMLLGHAGSPALQSTRMALTEFLAPVIGFLAQPSESIGAVGEQWQGWQNIYAQNATLRDENAKLKQWRRAAIELEAENQSLRHLLKLAPVASGHYLTGKMIGGALAGSFGRSHLLNLGSEDGVVRDMAVMTGDGLVGRVMEAGGGTSRVMLVTDINSHIAVMTEQGREQAVATGNNEALLELRYLPADSKIAVGETVLTSGDAALMPAGIPVGEVVKIENGRVLLKPAVDWSRLSYVSLISPER